MVEQSTVNRLVPGSSPGSPANKKTPDLFGLFLICLGAGREES